MKFDQIVHIECMAVGEPIWAQEMRCIPRIGETVVRIDGAEPGDWFRVVDVIHGAKPRFLPSSFAGSSALVLVVRREKVRVAAEG